MNSDLTVKEEIIYKKVSELKNNPKNPRKNDGAVDSVAKSIERYGFKNPLIIDTDNVVWCGNTRLKAARKLKIKEVPCIVVKDLTQQQMEEYALLDNKTNEIAEWDMEMLSEIMPGLDLDEFELDWGLPEIEEEKEIEEDDYVMPEQLEIKIKQGEVWKLGNHRLMCGDSTNKEDVEKLMDGCLADLVVTDPPYNVAYEGGTGMTIENDNMSSENFLNFLNDAFSCMCNALKEGGAFYVWFASREHINFETALNMNNLKVREELIWVKNAMTLGRQDYQWRHEPCLYGWKEGASHFWNSDRSQTTVLEFNKPNRNDIHPTMKPVDLFAYLIKNSSKKNDSVLDLFGGSGTTMIACEQLDRNAYIMEYDEKYATAIIDRWEKLTGKKAEKIC